MTKVNWTLIACLYSILNTFETYHDWDLDIGEASRLFEFFYLSLSKGLPKSKDEINEIFECAYLATWGPNHECDQTKDEVMADFMYGLYDLDPELDMVKFVKSLGLARKVND